MKKLLIVLFAVMVNLSYSQNYEGKAFYKQGMKYYKSHKFLLSIGMFQKAIDEGYQDARAYFYLGNALCASQSLKKGVQKYLTALEITEAPDFQGVIYFNIGNAYYQVKELSNSIRAFDQAYRLNPELKESFWPEGMAYYRLRNKDKTISSWENYLVLLPKGPQSDNIRKALAILKQDDFHFPNINQSTNTNAQFNPNDLLDIEGVLDKVKLKDKGKAEDSGLEDIEM